MLDPEFYSPAELRREAQRLLKTLRRRISDGTIPAVRIGRLIRVPASALASVGRPLTVAKAAR